MIKILKHHKISSTIVLVLIALGVVYYFHIRPNNQITKQPPPKPTIKQLPTKANSSVSQPAGSTSSSKGTTVDNSGKSPSTIATLPSQWVQSQSGAITLQQPIANSTIASGFLLNGLASVGSIGYTLIDNQSGVISQGTISVVGGKFSATINFKSTSSTGRLDVFSTDPNGKEINEVQIPVNF